MVKFYLKKILRPLIPDRLMARIRMRQHSKDVRWNVDVFPLDSRQAGRWRDSTPDTYRVRLDRPAGTPRDDVEVIVDPAFPTPEDVRDLAVRLLADPWLGAVAAGEVDPPRITDRRRSEPAVGPRSIAVRRSVLEEVGGVPPGEHPLPALLQRIRDAGHPYGLIPLPRTGAPTVRSDPIDLHPVLVLTLVPMHDVGGGARSTQIALELVRQGYHVTLVSLYQAQESVDLGLRFVHPDLEQHHAGRFDPHHLIARCSRRGTVLVEGPAEDLVELAELFKSAGWEVVYDIIDDWSDPALGGDWFEEDVEERLLTIADRVVASAPDLVERARRLGRSADLVPNAVNVGLFGVGLPERPKDLPEAETLIGYHGSLYGDWFDWSALRAVAEAFPDAAVVVIGDDKAPRPAMPDNVHFLGLKPQTALPAYLQRFDVGIIPFKLNDTTHAVSPLKAFEYLASGVPIAAPPLRALEGLDGVHLDTDLVEAVRLASAGARPDRGLALKEHAWSNRVAALMGGGHEPSTQSTVVVVSRPAVHWAPSQRLTRVSRLL